MAEAHERFRSNRDGAERRRCTPRWRRCRAISSASAWPARTGHALRGRATPTSEFTIMSVSKPFVFALVCQALGAGAGTRAARRQQHRAAVQLARGGRAQRGRSDEPDGELGRDRDDEPRAGRNRRGQVAGSSSTACPASRAATSSLDERDVPLGVGDERPQPGDRPPARALRARSTAIPPRRSTSTRGSAAST